MRNFGGIITLGTVLEALKAAGFRTTRVTYYRKEKEFKLPHGKRTKGKLQWRVYTKADVEEIVRRFKEEYNVE